MNNSKIYDLSSFCEDEDLLENCQEIEALGKYNRRINVIPLLFLYESNKIPNIELDKINEGDIVFFEDRFEKYLVIKYKNHDEYYSNNSKFLNIINKYNNGDINNLCLLKFEYDECNECILIPIEGIEFNIDYIEIDECQGQIIDLYYLKKEFKNTIVDLSNEPLGYERLLIKRNDGLTIIDCSDIIKDKFNNICNVLLPIMSKNDQVNNVTHIVTILKNLEDNITEEKGITISEYIKKNEKNKNDEVKSISKMKKNELLDFIKNLLKNNENLKMINKSLKEDIEEKNSNIESLIKKERINNENNRNILLTFINLKKDIGKKIDNMEKIIKNNRN